MSRRVTSAERESLIKAYLACRTWRSENGLLIGEHGGWRIWLSDGNGNPVGLATNLEMDVTIELTPPVIRPWMRRARGLMAPRG